MTTTTAELLRPRLGLRLAGIAVQAADAALDLLARHVSARVPYRTPKPTPAPYAPHPDDPLVTQTACRTEARMRGTAGNCAACGGTRKWAAMPSAPCPACHRGTVHP